MLDVSSTVFRKDWTVVPQFSKKTGYYLQNLKIVLDLRSTGTRIPQDPLAIISTDFGTRKITGPSLLSLQQKSGHDNMFSVFSIERTWTTFFRVDWMFASQYLAPERT